MQSGHPIFGDRNAVHSRLRLRHLHRAPQLQCLNLVKTQHSSAGRTHIPLLVLSDLLWRLCAGEELLRRVLIGAERPAILHAERLREPHSSGQGACERAAGLRRWGW